MGTDGCTEKEEWTGEGDTLTPGSPLHTRESDQRGESSRGEPAGKQERPASADIEEEEEEEEDGRMDRERGEGEVSVS